MVNRKLILIATCVYLGTSGLCLTFLPQEIAEFFSGESNPSLILAFQLIGSLYLGFCILNWMTKSNLIGGIYLRPLVVGNFMHFLVSAFALIKSISDYDGPPQTAIIIVAIIYSFFAVFFGYLMMNNPQKIGKDDNG